MLLEYEKNSPSLGAGVFVAPNATLIGQVVLEAESSVWFGAVLRGDNDRITIGARSNLQEGCIVHVDPGLPVTVGEDCVIGHGAILHGCTVGNRVLVGIRATVLNHAHIPDDVIVAAGALVPERARLESGQLYMGSPARAVRPLKPEELERVRYGAAHYVEKAARYRQLV
ncbi:MAG: gamma carbonic anhydrase family protein [Vulcanimicrobiota bacterium]